MGVDAPAAGARPDPAHDGERGATLPLVALLSVFLFGMVAFGTDLGWLYLNASRAQNAADAAALAGVTAMPPNGSFVGSVPYTTAQSVAAENGFVNGSDGVVVAPEQVQVAGHAGTYRSNQLRVQVTRTVPTFFLRLFGMDTVDVSRTATAEYLPPLRLGSDEPLLGNDPLSGVDVGFYLSVNGEYTAKEQGDPFSTQCYRGTSSLNPRGDGSDCDLQNLPTAGTFRDPAYYYAVEVLPADAGTSLTVEAFDPAYFANTSGLTNEFGWSTPSQTITFALYPPDTTPFNPADNALTSAPVCPPRSFAPATSGDPIIEHWTSLCTTTAQAGVYVLAVSVDRGSESNNFSLRASTGGPGLPAVYGIGSMSIRARDPDSTARFKLAKVEEMYAGRDLIVTLYDPGEVFGATGVITFTGDAAAYDCEYRVRSTNGTTVERNWGPDDGDNLPTGRCRIVTSNGTTSLFNGKWLDVRIPVPSDYTCSVASGCWWIVSYTFTPTGGGTPSVTDRTTWLARISGQPIHLIFEGD